MLTIKMQTLIPQQLGFATLESVEGGVQFGTASFTLHVVKIPQPPVHLSTSAQGKYSSTENSTWLPSQMLKNLHVWKKLSPHF